MGAESSALQGLTIENTLPGSDNNCFTVQEAKFNDGSRTTIFTYKNAGRKSDPGNVRLENSAKFLRTVRHPTIIKFIAAGRYHGESVLVTEPVKPLTLVFDHLSPAEICAGLYNIVEALIFLHEKVGVSHNNVCLNSIYVGEDGGWKLGGMECAYRYTDAAFDILEKNKDIRDERAIPPEDKEKRQTMKYTIHARDAYGFGMLVENLMENLGELGAMAEEFELKMQNEFLIADPNQRPKLSSLLEDALFRNDFIEIMCFLKNITVKSDDDKEKFFSQIVEKLLRLPMQLVSSRLVTPLLSRFVLLDSAANLYLIRHLLTPRIKGSTYPEGTTPVFNEKLFKAHVIPELFKIFHVRDAHIRLVLLEHFPLYVSMFDKETLTDVILPQVLLGLKDRNDNILALSLQALADLVPVIGGHAVVGRDRMKIFAEGKPKRSVNKVSTGGTRRISSSGGTVAVNGQLHRIDDDDDGLIHTTNINKKTQEETRKHSNETKKVRPPRKERHQRSPKKEKVTLQMLAKKTNFDVSSTPTQQCVVRTDGSGIEISDTVETEEESGTKTAEENLPESVENIDDISVDRIADDIVEAEDEWSDWDDLPQSETKVDDNTNSSHIDEVKISSHSSVNHSDPVVDHSLPDKQRSNGLLELKPRDDKENNSTRTVLSQSWKKNKKDPDLSSIWAGAKTKYAARQSSQASIKQRDPNAFSEIFDIKAIEIKTKGGDADGMDDFFSDMQPEIKTQHVDLFSLLASSNTTDVLPPAASSSLAYNDQETTVASGGGGGGGGWDDEEINWADLDHE